MHLITDAPVPTAGPGEVLIRVTVALVEPHFTRSRHDAVVPLPLFSTWPRLDADLHVSEDGGAAAPYPVVAAASGYQGLKVVNPGRFARALTRRGFAVLAFDYCGSSALDDEASRALNARVDGDGETPEQVAPEWLREKDFIS